MGDVLKVEQISKRFPGVLAVDRVSLHLQEGEILALVGENGAGKSTLTQIIGGAQRPDEGLILLGESPVSFNSPEDAIRFGISIVFQELSLVGSLSVAENIFANRQPVGALNTIRWGDLYKQTAEFLDSFDLDLNPHLLVKQLSMGQQQILEILKAISTKPKVLILDEPTSSLTEGEINYLFENIRRLQAEGMSFIYITHKLSEVFQIANRVMVMRDGRHIDTKPINEVNESDLVALMVGRQITNMYGARSNGNQDEYLRVDGFSRRGAFQDISFSLKRGEILGFAGLVGAGRTEVGRAIFGIDRKDSGRVTMNGVELHVTKPQDAIRHKIAYLTEDRKGQGLFLGMSLRENLVAPAMQKFTNAMGFLRRSLLDRHAAEMVREYAIATPSVDKKMLNLSGGNQQKALVAMWMGIQPEVIIFDEPTRGVDVGARAEIYARLRNFAASGVGVIMISSDLPELLGMCDRILVMHQGRVTGEVVRADFSEALILSYAAGLEQPAQAA